MKISRKTWLKSDTRHENESHRWKLFEWKRNWINTSGQESDELEDSERLVQFDGFYKDQTVYIYLVTRTMSLKPLKDSMSLQNVILKTTG